MEERMASTAGEIFAKAWLPNPVEAEYQFSEIEGEVPRELNGTFYRVGPSQRIEPAAGYSAMHIFDGDALMHAFRFENGRASYRGRYARTKSFLREQEEGVYCFGGFNLPPDKKIENAPFNYQPQTNAIFHNGRLFAMGENFMPFEMDPVTLESIGPYNYDGKMLGRGTTAHPRIDGRTGQMIIHGYQPQQPRVQFYVLESDGRVSVAEQHDAPWPSFMHDIAVTENYAILPLGSIFFDVSLALKGATLKSMLSGRNDLPLTFGVRGRAPGSSIRWIETGMTGFFAHPGNAYEFGSKIILDGVVYEDPQALLDSFSSIKSGEPGTGFVSYPYLFEIDLETGSCKHTKLSEIAAEFPRIDDRLVGYKNRYGYASTADPDQPAITSDLSFRSISRYDREGGVTVRRAPVQGQWVGEPIFVPRTKDAAEDEGFVMFQMYDAPSNRTAIEILDAANIDAAPLARLWMDVRIPLTFHGNWANQH